MQLLLEAQFVLLPRRQIEKYRLDKQGETYEGIHVQE